MPDVQKVDFVSVMVRDIEAGKRFYGEVLGLGLDPRAPEAYPQYDIAGLTLLITTPEAIGREFAASNAAIALRVPDVAAARAELEGHGVTFFGDTMDTGVCHMAIFTDPDGNTLILHHRYAPFQDGSMP